MSKKSPMSLSLEFLNLSGWTCQIVERWIPGANVRQDCLGIGDILCYKTREIALVQTTSITNFAARKNKILASPHLAGWKKAGGRILLHAWGDSGLREEEL